MSLVADFFFVVVVVCWVVEFWFFFFIKPQGHYRYQPKRLALDQQRNAKEFGYLFQTNSARVVNSSACIASRCPFVFASDGSFRAGFTDRIAISGCWIGLLNKGVTGVFSSDMFSEFGLAVAASWAPTGSGSSTNVLIDQEDLHCRFVVTQTAECMKTHATGILYLCVIGMSSLSAL